jgi:HEAT repeat protein
MSEKLARALNLREGEGRTLAVLAGFLLLNTANTTLISAAKNGLFLSVYSGDLIPYAIIAAAFLTAAVAVVFQGVISGTARRSLAVWLTGALMLSLVACWAVVGAMPKAAFAAYLWLSAVQVLVITHTWDYVSDLLTGRQAKRLLPLIGMGASIGAILGGAGVAPAALRLGTLNLLLISCGLLALALPFLWGVPEPLREDDEEAIDVGAVRAFMTGASRGFRALGHEKLLRLLAFGMIALTLTGTLIDLQLKVALQEAFARDRITAIYGLMSVAIGTGTLLMQLWASRVVLPKWGVSVAALIQAGSLTLASAGAAVAGGVMALVALQSIDDIMQFSLQKPVEQVSLLPFPGAVKSAAMATLGGVLRPLSKAAAGGVALGVAARPELLPLATVISAAVAVAIYARHRRTYMAALEGALARHTVDFSPGADTPLIIGPEALSVIDRGLSDVEPTVVVFATSLLEQFPAGEAVPRAARMLAHTIPEVRAEAGKVIGRIDGADSAGAGRLVAERLKTEEDPFVLSALLSAAGSLPTVGVAAVKPFAAHGDEEVRRQAMVALVRLGVPGTQEQLRTLLHSSDSSARSVAAGAVGDLGLTALMADVAGVLEDPNARPVALEALGKLGAAAVPVMVARLEQRDLPLPIRRSLVTTLASVEGREAREALLSLVEEPALGPPALTSLLRMRLAENIDPVPPDRLRIVLDSEIRRGLRFSLAASALREEGEDSKFDFVADELEELRLRSVHRVLRILLLSYDAQRIKAVRAALLSDDAGRRSNALELLEGTISGESSQAVMPFMDATADGFAVSRVAELLDDAAELLSAPAETLTRESDWWPRALGLHVLGRDDDISTPGRSKDDPDSIMSPPDTEQDDDMIPLIEKVMILKGSQLFRNFPGPDLAGIASLATVMHLENDEVVFEQGDEGDAFYMVVRGKIRISRGATELAILETREGFGEMAILDSETRSATATAAERATLLRIDRDSFDRLIEQNPAVARGIYRVLNERLRNTLAQVAAG